MPKIDEILKLVKKAEASDLHLVAGEAPIIRKSGVLEKTSHRPLSDEQVRALVFEVISDEQIRRFERDGDLDFAYGTEKIGRFRINVYKTHSGVGASIRLVSTDLIPLAHLGLPAEVLRMSEQKSGLILVTGPTNSGKTTTLSAMVDHINRNSSRHIITLEDPIECVHSSINSLVNQRQIGLHVESFGRGLRAALREDPDVILLGEMRDIETISLAVMAAEVGLLVLGTLHTNSAAQTVDRIIDVFPADQQQQVRVTLADSLLGVVSQQLLRRADRGGRIIACELLVKNHSIANLIREGKTHQITSTMQTGRKLGMITLDDRLRELVDDRQITAQEAARVASEPLRFLSSPTETAKIRTNEPVSA